MGRKSKGAIPARRPRRVHLRILPRVPFIGVSGAGRILGLSVQQVRNLADQGKLAAVRTEDSIRLFHVAEVQALRDARAASAAEKKPAADG